MLVFSGGNTGSFPTKKCIKLSVKKKKMEDQKHKCPTYYVDTLVVCVVAYLRIKKIFSAPVVFLESFQ